ncbi:hypothetical protein V7S43_010502 [Phytophthora oleae]|uniref:Uncharacterized protein n=1 Tax=Phytophthora oleae TaxID=2107226 RepID=A0ABD3FCU5_9STRA
MILQQEIEVPYTSLFLVQSMDAYEQAVFSDMMLAIEYPLYAHLAPGQRLGENMSKAALQDQIYVGAEAAVAQQQEIAEFKSVMSRIYVNKETRVMTVTFKGKQGAKRWAGWKMPLGSRLLPLVDYEEQKERALITSEIVRIDYYSFTTAVRKGSTTSRDMYWLLAEKMGMQVQTLRHTVTGETGLNDKQWAVEYEEQRVQRS